MATLAPYSAKRTAIAWPMPELPPVTRTFLPFSPRRPSARVGLGAVAMWGVPPRSGRCVRRAVPSRAAALRAASRRAPARPSASARGSQRGRREGDAEALAPHDHAAVAVEAHVARDRVVLRADVALEVAEVDEAVVEAVAGSGRRRGAQVDLQGGAVGRAEVLEAHVAAAVGR